MCAKLALERAFAYSMRTCTDYLFTWAYVLLVYIYVMYIYIAYPNTIRMYIETERRLRYTACELANPQMATFARAHIEAKSARFVFWQRYFSSRRGGEGVWRSDWIATERRVTPQDGVFCVLYMALYVVYIHAYVTCWSRHISLLRIFTSFRISAWDTL